jgi:hypothetical protein
MMLITVSCKDVRKENAADAVNNTDVDDGHMGKGMEMQTDNPAMDSPGNAENGEGVMVSQSTRLIAHYLQLKDALVADNKDTAAKAGGMLASALGKFDTTPYSPGKELSGILEDAKGQAEYISKSPIHIQREHFEELSKDMLDLIGITGTKNTLYQDYCPMANNNKGAMWLSARRDIRNPYFGSKMLKCGTIQRELN